MKNCHHALARSAIYAGAKPEPARPTGMVIKTRSGRILRDRDRPTCAPTPRPRDAAPESTAPVLVGIPFVNVKPVYRAGTVNSWED